MRLILFIVICFLIYTSCSEDNHEFKCIEGQIEIAHLDCDSGYLFMDLIYEDFTIIRSNSSYDSIMLGTCHQAIDFSKFDLIAGWVHSPSMIDTIIYELVGICPENRLVLTVEVFLNGAAMPDGRVWNAVIPKLSEQESLNVIVNSQMRNFN